MVKLNEIMHDFWFFHHKYGNVRVEDFDADYGDDPWVVFYSEAIRHKDGYKYGYDSIALDKFDEEWFGVPLTEEILESNGFVKQFERLDSCSSYSCYYRISENIVLCDAGKFGYVFCVEYRVPDDGWVQVEVCSVHYVHELQMVLCMLKIEKEIVL